MVGKRRLSVKARVEAASKRRATTPPPEEPSSSESVDRGLPTRLEDGQPLPTLNEPQPEVLSLREYQSIAESGILAASLQRSRDRWLTESVFERYWTKPSKKKSQVVQPPNPPKETMVKLGPCTLTIEPHVFETMLYTVKEPPPPPPPVSHQQPLQRPILQYGPPNGVSHSASISMNHPSQSPRLPGQMPQQTAHIQQPRTGTVPGPSMGQQSTFQSTPTPNTVQQADNRPPQQSHQPIQNGVPGPPPPAPKPSPDPVIQMLATKAATDQDLKALMRIVASGKASHTQLKIFQSHIDELTAILHAQGNAQRAFPAVSAHPSAPPSASNAVQHNLHPVSTPRPNSHPAPTHPTTPHSNQIPASMTVKSDHPGQGLPPQQTTTVRSKGHVMSHKSNISAILFEFISGSGDRFLFPKYSILEYLPGGTQVIASFLVVRKGSNSVSGSYDPTLDYYQPVTMRLSAESPRILEPLAKVVADPTEARKYMDDIMDNMTRAEYVHLAMRLPRDPDDIDDEDEGGSQNGDRGSREGSARANATPTHSVVPSKKKIVKKTSFSTDRSSAEPSWSSPASKQDNNSKVPRSRRGRVADPTKACHLCHTSTTSLWRKAEVDGESVTVCNACGIKWKTNSTRAIEAAQAAASGQPPFKKTRVIQKPASAKGQGSPPPLIQNTSQHPYQAVNGAKSPVTNGVHGRALAPITNGEIEMRDAP